MDELSLQEANWFQNEQVVHQESVGVFQGSYDASSQREDVWGSAAGYVIVVRQCVTNALCVYLWASTRAWDALSSV